jgi:hypothetical protein
MNNFISTFDELNKLYEEDERKGKKVAKDVDADEGLIAGALATAGAAAAGKVIGDKISDKLSEGADEEVEDIVDDEVPAEEAPTEEAPTEEEPIVRQLALECANCGAITIRDEADVKVDEEADLVNMEDACEFCEEAKGHKIVGVVTPYEEAEEEVTEGLDERYDDEIGNGWNRSTPYSSQSGRGVWKNETPDWWKKQGGTDSSWSRAKEQNHENNKPYRP